MTPHRVAEARRLQGRTRHLQPGEGLDPCAHGRRRVVVHRLPRHTVRGVDRADTTIVGSLAHGVVADNAWKAEIDSALQEFVGSGDSARSRQRSSRRTKRPSSSGRGVDDSELAGGDAALRGDASAPALGSGIPPRLAVADPPRRLRVRVPRLELAGLAQRLAGPAAVVRLRRLRELHARLPDDTRFTDDVQNVIVFTLVFVVGTLVAGFVLALLLERGVRGRRILPRRVPVPDGDLVHRDRHRLALAAQQRCRAHRRPASTSCSAAWVSASWPTTGSSPIPSGRSHRSRWPRAGRCADT